MMEKPILSPSVFILLPFLQWARAAAPAPSCLSCGSQSSFTSGELYSYGPRYTTGWTSKFPCGGGEDATHSRVFACQGFFSAFFPANKLQMKLYRKTICEAPSINALMVIKIFQCCIGCRNSY